MVLDWKGAVLGAAAAFLISATPAGDNGPQPVAPAASELTLGATKLYALRDTGFVTPNDGADFGSDVGPKAVAAALAAAGLPTDAIRLDIDALLVREPGRIILVDAGLGPRFKGALPQSLAIAGVTPGEITDVLITHTHLDHVGGLLTADGKPAFPRARIWMSKKEWAWLNAQPHGRKLADAIAPQVRTFEPGSAILPGITPIALYGHTPGHAGYQIAWGGAEITDIGDTAHSSVISLEHPEWRAGIDNDPPEGEATRVAELARLASAHALIFAPHFPFPGIGWIEKRGTGYAWKPDPDVRAVAASR
ncbi:MAG TPA: MBL fold metallo-hydrolase [Caulobacteraceae bacterium]|nr:MBL fold metallo-hydrolase [Caulobacteraceae bacterium]